MKALAISLTLLLAAPLLQGCLLGSLLGLTHTVVKVEETPCPVVSVEVACTYRKYDIDSPPPIANPPIELTNAWLESEEVIACLSSGRALRKTMREFCE